MTNILVQGSYVQINEWWQGTTDKENDDYQLLYNANILDAAWLWNVVEMTHWPVASNRRLHCHCSTWHWAEYTRPITESARATNSTELFTSKTKSTLISSTWQTTFSKVWSSDILLTCSVNWTMHGCVLYFFLLQCCICFFFLVEGISVAMVAVSVGYCVCIIHIVCARMYMLKR